MISQNSEIHRIQHAFRGVMNAVAHPGVVYAVPLDAGRASATGLDAALDTVVRIFVDQAVTFAYMGDAVRERAIASETRSRAAGVSQASFVIVGADAGETSVEYAVERASRGNLISPEKGATVLLGCDALSQEPDKGLFGFSVSGPGVADTNRFFCDSDAWLRARAARLDEYPCGIEIVLVDPNGNVVAIPRTSNVARADADELECESEGVR